MRNLHTLTHCLRTILVLSALIQLVHAQEFEVSLYGGASGYMGDLNPENPMAFNDWSAAASVKYNINHTWGVRALFTHANTFAQDAGSRVAQRQERNLSFFGSVQEAALLVDFNFFKWLPQRGRIVYTPYIFAGVGGIHFDPQWYLRSTGGREAVKLRTLRTEYALDPNTGSDDGPYSPYALTVPVGAGFRYNLRGPWSIGVELTYRHTFTDYLDDVSGNYPQQNLPPVLAGSITFSDWHYLAFGRTATSASVPAPGTQRGDGRRYDSFMTISVTVSYTIFRGGCPEWR